MLAFKESVSDAGIVLLMPDPTSREIRRHLRARAEDAVTAMEGAAKKSPFLRKLPKWPLGGTTPNMVCYELNQIATRDLKQFLALFEVIELDYEGVSLATIMDWRDNYLAPFSEKKKGEFSDAFVVAALERYRRASDESVAVISKDSDFKAACERFSGLMYFPSLVAYSEALNSADSRLAAVQAAINEGKDSINKRISEVFAESGFTIEANWDGDVEDVEIVDFDGLDFRVVGIGDNTCLVAFEGEVEYSAYVSYDDLSTATYEKGEPVCIHHTIEGTIQDHAEISGVVSLHLGTNGNTIADIRNVTLDQSDFAIDDNPIEY